MHRIIAARPSRLLSSRADQRGFSLAEMLVASAVFLLVVLAAYQVFQRSHETYTKGQNQADMVQNARVAFDQMVNDVRLAGFEFDLDGPQTVYPNQPDEALEYMHRRAIFVRGNFDFDKELKGREQGLEQPDQTVCCPVVTTGNDEIIGYVLGKPVGQTQPTGSISMKFDTTGTLATNDTVRRDALVVKSGNTAGTILNEETITVPNVELAATLADPPYVLYRVNFNEDGSVNRQPLVDNVKDLEFTYYDGNDAVIVGTQADGTVVPGTSTIWGDDNGQDKEAGRATRWSITRIKVTVQTMTPEKDLRVAGSGGGGGVGNFQGRRLFRLEEDISPPNLGRRGQTDRDVNPPEPVRNVEICTGECGFVRVSWEPGPPEDKIADHIVVLCNGQCSATDFSNRIGSFVVIASYDSVPEPDREYATFTKEDASGITDGATIWAWVIARNFAGTESECPVADCNVCCKSLAGATVSSTTRLDTFTSGAGSGYSTTDTAWPNAKLDNSSGNLITTDPVDSSFPLSDRISISLKPPAYTLNRANGAGSPPFNWTTKSLANGGAASIDCHKEESTPGDGSDDPALRTPAENLPADPSIANVYVYRVSGSDSWNWNGDSNQTGVTDPRNFIPGPDNLYDFVNMTLSNDSVTFEDAAVHSFVEVGGSQDQYDDLWTGTATPFFSPSGGHRPIARPPKALAPGEVYYYRFRAVDVCWNDKPTNNGADPPDGVENDNTLAKAWSLSRDYANNNQWRQNSLESSPFYPPLRPANDATGQRDKPDQGTHDADDVAPGNNPINGFAITGYALPDKTSDGSAWVKPEKPTEFYLAKVDDGGSDLLDFGATDHDDARVVFNSAKRNAPSEAGVEPTPATYTRYRLYRKRATSHHPNGAEMAFDVATATRYLEFRTPGQQAQYYLTLDTSGAGGKGAPSAATFNVLRDIGTQLYPADCASGNDGSLCYPWIYRLVTVQCPDSTLNDGIDTSTVEESAPSRPFIYPCQFYDQVQSVTVTPAHATHPSGVSAVAQMVDGNGIDDAACDGDPGDSTDVELRSGRLVAYRYTVPQQGDFIGTSDWKANSACNLTFTQTEVDKALRGFTGEARFVVELSDVANNGPATDTGSLGCRVRSDLLGNSGDFGTSVISCAAGCGTNNNNGGNPAKIFNGSSGNPPHLETELVNDNTIRVTIPKTDACDNDPFTLYQLEFDLEHVSGGAIPNYDSGSIVSGLVGPQRPLPDPSVTGNFGDGDTGESELFGTDGDMRLRFHQGWCPAGTCSYPKVAAGTSPLVVDLTFEGDACDIVLTSFNFRVAIQNDGDDDAEELLCTNRTDPHAPPSDGLTNPDGGGGRGPLDDPAGVCSDCDEDCDPCFCPVNQSDNDIAMDTDPTVDLTDDTNDPNFPGDPGVNEKLVLSFQQNGCSASGCDFAITSITFGLRCQVSRDCDPNVFPLATLDPGRPEIVHSDTSVTPIDPLWDHVQATESNNDIRYKFTNLSGVSIVSGEAFDLVFYFAYDSSDSEIYDLKIEFGAPLAFECGVGGNGPTECNKPSAVLAVD